MTNDYTPTTDVVRFRYVEYPYVAELEDELADGSEFDRWLAEHDRQVLYGYVKMPSQESLLEVLSSDEVQVRYGMTYDWFIDKEKATDAILTLLKKAPHD